MSQLSAELRAAINRLNALVLDAADLLRRVRDLEQQIRDGRGH